MKTLSGGLGRGARQPPVPSRFPRPCALPQLSSGYLSTGGTETRCCSPGSCSHLGGTHVCAFGQWLLICSPGPGLPDPQTLGLPGDTGTQPSLSTLAVGSPNNHSLPASLPAVCVLLGFPHTALLPTHPALCEGSEGGLQAIFKISKSPKEIMHLPQ